jgi:hypothetical protein
LDTPRTQTEGLLQLTRLTQLTALNYLGRFNSKPDVEVILDSEVSWIGTLDAVPHRSATVAVGPWLCVSLHGCEISQPIAVTSAPKPKPLISAEFCAAPELL